MLQEFSENELKKLRNALKNLDSSSYLPHLLLREQLLLIGASIKSVKDYLCEHPIDNVGAEVSYYKYYLPDFTSFQLYCTEKYSLSAGKPHQDGKALKKYYLDELHYLERFFLRHPLHYEYYKVDMHQMDEAWFCKAGNTDVPMPPVLEGYEAVDIPQVSYLFAKFIAYEQLRSDINELIAELDSPKGATEPPTIPTKLRKPLKWTGEKINLIELLHGLYVKKQVNDGKIGIGEFFEMVGEFFGIDLGIPKRGFDDLKLRKRLSKTHFLDSVREELLKKMEDEDAYDPEKLAGKKLGFS
ncbi:RteC domain-containing protein [Pedobacter sp. Du54]|uniref:RteC domain-containing protein n=1 Tax=Pedobacter anseongensis TaxID=3133439 RepID=UPI0030A0620C